MKARVTFKSSYFPVEPGEDEDINPGVFGKALAAWVADKLRERGVSVEKIVEEDFCRLVLVQRKPFMLWVGCANAEASATEWQLFLAAEVGLLGRVFRRVDPAPSFSSLVAHVRAIVEQVPGVSAIEWHPQ
jgi:hypothetical protein